MHGLEKTQDLIHVHKYLMGILDGSKEDAAKLLSEVFKRQLAPFKLQNTAFKHSKNIITVIVVKQ